MSDETLKSAVRMTDGAMDAMVPRQPPYNRLHLRIDDRNSSHVRVTVFFSGRNCGQLCLGVGEYQILGAAIMAGVGVYPSLAQHLSIECDDLRGENYAGKSL